jgi:hypothetical protein
MSTFATTVGVVIVVRGTKKFLERVGRPDADPPASAAVLGDWYASVLF